MYILWLIKNKNAETRAKQYRSNYRDGYGIGIQVKGQVQKHPTYITWGWVEKIVKRKNLDDLYCFEKKNKGKKVYESLQPQPTDNEILTIHRYYAFLKADDTYKKCVSWLSSGGNTQIAIAE